MAKYTVEHSCGHEREVDLLGKMSQRQWRLEQMEEELCPECLAKLEAEKTDDLPKLTGSPKQVEWAEKIRKNFMKETEEVLEDDHTLKILRRRHFEDRLTPEEVRDTVEKVLRRIASETTEAKVYIDNRDWLEVLMYHLPEILEKFGK